MSPQIAAFGLTDDARPVERITLRSDHLSASILTWGAVVQDVRLAGVEWPLTLGGADLAAYAGPMKSFGAIMGPVVNRIRNAQAPIGGTLHPFEANLDGQHTKHGGSHGTHVQIWSIEDAGVDHVTLSLTLPDGLSGFPGTRSLTARYWIDGAALHMELRGTTDRPTLLNLANHSYWNLDGSAHVAGHHLQIMADRYTENGADLMVTGRLCPVEGTQFDFRAPRAFEATPEIRYDMNYALAEAKRPLTPAARLTGASGVTMTLSTTEVGLQLFDLGSFDTGAFAGHLGTPYQRFSGIAFEAQGWPDAANHADWPSIEVTPDAPYHQHTSWRFAKV